jgi:DNA-binding CsgD family transcriptional regulator
VLEVEFDGYRYFLVRTLKPSRAPIELSPREKEIVRMVAQGHPNKIIAAVLNISSWTVCTHLRRVFAKLGVGSRAAMVARLHEMGSIHSGVLRSDAGNLNCGPISGTSRSNASKAFELSPKREKLAPSRRQTA